MHTQIPGFVVIQIVGTINLHLAKFLQIYSALVLGRMSLCTLGNEVVLANDKRWITMIIGHYRARACTTQWNIRDYQENLLATTSRFCRKTAVDSSPIWSSVDKPSQGESAGGIKNPDFESTAIDNFDFNLSRQLKLLTILLISVTLTQWCVWNGFTFS